MAAALAGVALSLSGCAGALQSAANAVFGGGSAPQANSVYAAEGFYTAGDNVTAEAIKNGTVNSVSAVQAIRDYDNAVYGELVKLRTQAEANKGVVSQLALDAFNAAFAKLFNEAASDGVHITIPAQYLHVNGGAQ